MLAERQVVAALSPRLEEVDLPSLLAEREAFDEMLTAVPRALDREERELREALGVR